MKTVHAVLFLMSFPLFASDIIEVRKLYEAKKFPAVIAMADKYPSLFKDAREMAWLARAHFEVKSFSKAVHQCFLTLEKEDIPWCKGMIRTLRDRQPGVYKLGLALYQLQILETRKAIDTLTEITLEHKDEALAAREILIPQLRKGGAYHLIHEHLSQALEHSPILKHWATQMENYKRATRAWLSKAKPKLPDDENTMYLWLAVSEENPQDFAQKLQDYYQKQLEEGGFNETLTVRKGALYLAEGKLEELAAYLEVVSPSIGSPIPRHSLLHLKTRLEELQKLKSLSQAPPAPVIAKVQQDVLAPTQALAIAGLPQSSGEPGLNLTPIDTSELLLASETDFSPFHRLYEEFLLRMSKNPSPYEQRFLYKELDKAYDKVSDHPKAGLALDAYVNTDEGKRFLAQANQMAQEFEKEDKVNAQFFNGEQGRFENALSMAKTREDKLRVLSNYAGKWEKLVFDDSTNLFVQGAAIAYRNTPEGKAIAKRVYELVMELDILPKDLDIPPDFLAERDWD